MTRSVSEFIDTLGGPTRVAAALGITAGAVRQWNHKNRIPRAAWPQLIDAYAAAFMLVALREIDPVGDRESLVADLVEFA
jgi:hypothetical protein